MTDRHLRSGNQRVIRVEHRAGLEQSKIVIAPAAVAGRRCEQSGQDRRAQIRTRLRQRIDDPVEAASFVVGRNAEPVELVDRQEGRAQHLDETRRGQCRRDVTASTLVARQATADRCPGHDRFDGVKTDLSADLLDIVVGISEIGPPTRWRDRQLTILVFYDGRTDGPEQFDGAAMLDIRAENGAREGIGDRRAR